MAALTLITHIPHAYLLRVFYFLPWQPVWIGLGTTIIANSVPFYFLRRRNAHNTKDTSALAVANDTQIEYTVGLVAAAMYAIPVVASMTSWLPVHLATYFSGLRTLEPAHTAVFWWMLVGLLPLGWAARNFFFYPLANTNAITLVNKASLAYSGHEKVAVLEFDPETATLTQTIHRNVFWHRYLPPRTQELLRRTMLATAWTVANTAFKAYVEVDGAELPGALGWGGVWGSGTVLAAGMLGWIAGVSV